MQLLLDEWISCAGQWKSSALYKKIVQRKTTSSHGARVWLTFQQISQKYGSEEVARQIVEAKLALDEDARKLQIKDHPDAPGVEAGFRMRIVHVLSGHVLNFNLTE